MAILRVNKTKDYTTMSNYHFKDKRLSLKAKGLLSEMLSLPENWDYSIAGLVAINKEEETAIKSTLNELKQFGYLVVTKLTPNETDSGRYEYIYDIYEIPKKQEGDFLGVEFLGVENQGLYKYTNNKITNNKNNNITTKIDIYTYYEERVGSLSPMQYELFNNLLDKVGEDKVKEAIDKTIANNISKNQLSYIIKVASNLNDTNTKIQNNSKVKSISTPNWVNEEIDSEEMSEEEVEELRKELEIFYK